MPRLFASSFMRRTKPLVLRPFNADHPTLYMVGWKEDGIVFYSVGSLFQSKTVMELMRSCQQERNAEERAGREVQCGHSPHSRLTSMSNAAQDKRKACMRMMLLLTPTTSMAFPEGGQCCMFGSGCTHNTSILCLRCRP